MNRWVNQREPSSRTETFGKIYDPYGNFFCDALEPSSPIAAGLYIARLRFSPSHGYAVFGLLNVPGHSDIEIHSGNTTEDTKDCTLLGNGRDTGFKIHDAARFPGLTTLPGVCGSRDAVQRFMNQNGVPEYLGLHDWDSVRSYVVLHPTCETFEWEIRAA